MRGVLVSAEAGFRVTAVAAASHNKSRRLIQ
jgi:hypothetical protein